MFQGVKIHASCNQTLMPQFEKQFVVGEWKVITNFSLMRATGFSRCTNHVYKMVFLKQTIITHGGLSCKNMFLDLQDFANIINGKRNPCFLIGNIFLFNFTSQFIFNILRSLIQNFIFISDVIGEIMELRGINNGLHVARKEIPKLEFTLRDIK